jgi:beta-lactamase class D
MDLSSGLTAFWLGGSLSVTPQEQEEFLVHLATLDSGAAIALAATSLRRQHV